MMRDMLTVTLRQDDGFVKTVGGISVMLPSKSITPLLGVLYGQVHPFSSQFPENNNQRRERFPEHFRDPVHQHLQQRTSKLLRVSSVVKALDRSSLNIYFCQHHTPSGQSRVYRVTQLRTDCVHCRETVGTGPVVLKVVRVTGAAFASPWNKCYCAPLFSHTHY